MNLILFSLVLMLDSEGGWDAGVAALQAGRAEEAKARLEKACPAFAQNPDRGYCLLLLGMARQATGELTSAREAFEASIALLPEGAPQYVDALAMAHRYLGELTGSEEHLRHALRLQVDLPDPLLAAATRRRLADLLIRTGSKGLDEAEVLWKGALNTFASTGAPPIEWVELDAVRARILMLRGRKTESRQMFYKVLRAKEGIFGERHPRTIQATLELAAALQAEGETARAIPLIRRAAWLQKR